MNDLDPLPPTDELQAENPQRSESNKPSHVTGHVTEVFSYYQRATKRDDLPLIKMWSENWAARGFEPVVLCEEDAKLHPGYEYFRAIIRRFPTVNPTLYEQACFLRHLAMAKRGGLLLDYDVFNVGLTPEGLRALMFGDAPVFLEPTRCPCAVFGNAKAFDYICDLLDTYTVKTSDHYNGKPHVSDQTILRQFDLPRTNICVEIGCTGSTKVNDFGDGWRTAKLIHFPNMAFSRTKRKGSKLQWIEEELKKITIG